jgi:hypothetical protein
MLRNIRRWVVGVTGRFQERRQGGVAQVSGRGRGAAQRLGGGREDREERGCGEIVDTLCSAARSLRERLRFAVA